MVVGRKIDREEFPLETPTPLEIGKAGGYTITMNTIALPMPSREPVAHPTPSRDLFGPLEESPVGERLASPTGLFAEVVFDRPLDHVYSYAIPERLREQVEVGKRVLASFGKNGKLTAGYCVGLQTTGPGRAVKDIVRVLDDAPLLTPNLLRLTRWMADYYLCGWGQVLNAVIPAGAKIGRAHV